MSQLDLAYEARTTTRHLSFRETGRSRPGRDLVLRLTEVLAVPVRDRNDPLQAVGLPLAYPAWALFPGVVGLTSEQFVDPWFGPGPLADRIVTRAEGRGGSLIEPVWSAAGASADAAAASAS